MAGLIKIYEVDTWISKDIFVDTPDKGMTRIRFDEEQAPGLLIQLREWVRQIEEVVED